MGRRVRDRGARPLHLEGTLMRSAYEDAAEVGQRLVDGMNTLTESLKEWLSTNQLSRRVLVVEDDLDVCTLLQTAISSSLNVPVDATQSGGEAYRKWRSLRHGVVVMDVQLMERDSGVHVAHSLGRDPRIILVSGLRPRESLDNAARALHADVVPKPFSVKALLELVQRRLDEAVPA